jgi:hypothetical protein
MSAPELMQCQVWQEETTVTVNEDTDFQVRQRLTDYGPGQPLPVGKDYHTWEVSSECIVRLGIR